VKTDVKYGVKKGVKYGVTMYASCKESVSILDAMVTDRVRPGARSLGL
jgi:hypothetical protein